MVYGNGSGYVNIGGDDKENLEKPGSQTKVHVPETIAEAVAEVQDGSQRVHEATTADDSVSVEGDENTSGSTVDDSNATTNTTEDTRETPMTFAESAGYTGTPAQTSAHKADPPIVSPIPTARSAGFDGISSYVSKAFNNTPLDQLPESVKESVRRHLDAAPQVPEYIRNSFVGESAGQMKDFVSEHLSMTPESKERVYGVLESWAKYLRGNPPLAAAVVFVAAICLIVTVAFGFYFAFLVSIIVGAIVVSVSMFIPAALVLAFIIMIVVASGAGATMFFGFVFFVCLFVGLCIGTAITFVCISGPVVAYQVGKVVLEKAKDLKAEYEEAGGSDTRAWAHVPVAAATHDLPTSDAHAHAHVHGKHHHAKVVKGKHL
eukprot:GFYU01005043.1.p1 GENE.GFYU01005043.1~~GFYU01005043.1.p1  ORF type:complete len:376 (+),score=85.90 GFYU01005043.1:266-1393(+)